MTRRLHLLAVPHAVTHRDYSTCAFSAKVLKFGKMMKGRGFELVHYGHAESSIDCDEHVTVTTNDDLDRSYPGFDWRKEGFHPYKLEDPIYQTFYANTIAALETRKRPGDFLLCFFGAGHKLVADAHPDMIAIEPGIGYSGGTFAKFKVYESYAAMHALYGQSRLAGMFSDGWYDAVVPNYFDPDDFTFSAQKDDYFLFLGRIGPGKGTHIASELVRRIGGKLVVAGPGHIEPDSHIEAAGVVGPEKRAELLAGARATICPSMYLEPFCGVQVESMLSGTPVISTDWGAFAEVNQHGVTGYRCRTMEQFEWAARNIGQIDPFACRRWAVDNYSLERVAAMYDEYFHGVAQIHGGAGWYQPNPERRELDWLRQRHPQGDTASLRGDPPQC